MVDQTKACKLLKLCCFGDKRACIGCMFADEKYKKIYCGSLTFWLSNLSRQVC